MKLNVGKRILLFLHWLLSLLICAAFALSVIVPDFAMGLYEKVHSALGTRNMQILGGAVLAIYLLLAVVTVCLIFRRRRRFDRGFITVDSSDTGKVRIAVSAIEQMVRQSVHNIDGISEMKISIDNMDDAIAIGVVASIVSGSHVPTITMNMQRAIRQFVEMNCGVAVRSVAININSVTSSSDGPRRRRRGVEPPAQPAQTFTPEPRPVQAEPSVSEPTPVPEEKAAPELNFDYAPHPEAATTESPDDAYAAASDTAAEADPLHAYAEHSVENLYRDQSATEDADL